MRFAPSTPTDGLVFVGGVQVPSPVSHLEHHDKSSIIIAAAIEVQTRLGVGLVERAYQAALALELQLRACSVRTEAPFAVTYKGVVVAQQRIDLMVAFTDAQTGVVTTVVVEVKHFRGDESLPRVLAALGSYVNLARAELGLLVNFGARPVFVKRVLPHVQLGDHS